MQVYGEVAKEVAPKRAKLKAAQDNLAKKQAQLATAQAKLAEVLAAVQALKDKYDESTANKKALEEELAGLEVKLERAEKLVTGLAGEKARWEASIADLETRVGNLPVRACSATVLMQMRRAVHTTGWSGARACRAMWWWRRRSCRTRGRSRASTALRSSTRRGCP